MQEYEADIFGLNAARQPDGEALVDLKLGDYRKLDPSPIEETIFLRPSQRTHPHHGRHAVEGGENVRAPSSRHQAGRSTMKQGLRRQVSGSGTRG